MDCCSASSKPLTANMLKTLQAGGARVWNVLTDHCFTGEMIPGSQRVPLDTIGKYVRTAQLAKGAEIVVYCAGPRCPQSGMAAEKLLALGFENVIAYEGGLEDWKQAGFPVDPA